MFLIKVFLQIAADFSNTSEQTGDRIAYSILIPRA